MSQDWGMFVLFVGSLTGHYYSMVPLGSGAAQGIEDEYVSPVFPLLVCRAADHKREASSQGMHFFDNVSHSRPRAIQSVLICFTVGSTGETGGLEHYITCTVKSVHL